MNSVYLLQTDHFSQERWTTGSSWQWGSEGYLESQTWEPDLGNVPVMPRSWETQAIIYCITISWPGKESRVVVKGIPLKTVQESQQPPHTPASTSVFAGRGAGVEAEPCLDLCVFLLPTLTIYVYNLGQGKRQSNTWSNAGLARLLSFPKWAAQAHSLATSGLNTTQLTQFPQWKVQEGMLPLLSPSKSWTFWEASLAAY